ncbi:LuxR C-terminal-related transcriptional regulator [Luteipulveratus sp. YIM 133132]|uniref:helix-turn-helix transcriptional regulator n=1 Tax=Luteipulveratus flavus TaxID=3031728 RepID=UPI0023B1B324|nr:LuxR C-terminal-related transcriptional regulator [Luteipulveratus sp. YIM 133132]MDE9365889.1 LuxR C-terminal-related transcriptional regulator [Luteipulveratus sp. YIM 133132]
MGVELVEQSPIAVLRRATADISTGVGRTGVLQPARMQLARLGRRETEAAPGISDVWIGREDVVVGLTRIQATVQHTVRSSGPAELVEISDRSVALHERGAQFGIRAQTSRRRIAAELLCRSRRCRCHSLGGDYYGESSTIPLGMFLLDERLALVKTNRRDAEMVYVVTADREVVQNVARHLQHVQDTSRPVLPRDRRRNLRPTLRQLRILHLMTYGLTDEKIAAALKVTSRTVRNDVRSLYVMFEVQSRFELGGAYTRWMAGE